MYNIRDLARLERKAHVCNMFVYVLQSKTSVDGFSIYREILRFQNFDYKKKRNSTQNCHLNGIRTVN